MITPATLILNPYARSQKATAMQDRIAKVCGGSDVRMEITEGPGSGTRKAADAVRSGVTTIIAAGGDGTINEVLNGIVGTDAALGIIPIGSVNVLARELKIPLGIEASWKVIEDGHTRAVDVVRVDFNANGQSCTRYFVQLAGIGLDAYIVSKVTWEKKRRWGPLSYVFESFRAITRTLPRITVRIDGGREIDASFALIGNGSFYGGPFPVFNRASMTDGKLDVCLFESSGYLDLLVYLQAIARGVQDSTKGVRYEHGTEVEIQSKEEVPIELDGEFAGHLPAKMKVLPRALKIFVPRALPHGEK